MVCCKDLPALFTSDDADYGRDHSLCRVLRPIKAMVDKAIENGSQVKCPSCGLSGRKDDACLHMKCPRPGCEIEFCYLCGLSVNECDKGAPNEEDGETDDIYLHNRDWESNPNRCP